MRRSMRTCFAVCLVFAFSTTLVAAQEGTPESATPVTGDAIEVLLVQMATSSALTPLEAGENGATHALTLSGGAGQTVYFADRPNREVGMVPTTDVVDALDAETGSAPNAALVAQTAEGEEEIIVIELLSGEADAATGDVTYQVVLLADFAEVALGFERTPVSEVTELREYEASHLFIDDDTWINGYIL